MPAPHRPDEVTALRAERPNDAGHLEALLARRTNLIAYGQDTAGVDAALAAAGYTPAATREAAAKSRRQAADAERTAAAVRAAEKAAADKQGEPASTASTPDPSKRAPAGRGPARKDRT